MGGLAQTYGKVNNTTTHYYAGANIKPAKIKVKKKIKCKKRTKS